MRQLPTKNCARKSASQKVLEICTRQVILCENNTLVNLESYAVASRPVSVWRTEHREQLAVSVETTSVREDIASGAVMLKTN
jgi:hypothetical protein